jgi:hypothetical protein
MSEPCPGLVFVKYYKALDVENVLIDGRQILTIRPRSPVYSGGRIYVSANSESGAKKSPSG